MSAQKKAEVLGRGEIMDAASFPPLPLPLSHPFRSVVVLNEKILLISAAPLFTEAHRNELMICTIDVSMIRCHYQFPFQENFHHLFIMTSK